MKLYKTFFAAVAMLASVAATAQGSKCNDNIELFKIMVVSAKYTDAAAMLPDLQKNCAGTRVDFYKYAGLLYNNQIETARNEQDKKKAIDGAVSLYNAQIKNFPTSNGEIKKALLLSAQGMGTDKDLFALLDHAFVVNKANFTDYRALDLYFKLYMAKFQAKENNITPEAFLERYVDVLGQVSVAKDEVAVKRAEYAEKKEKQVIDTEEEKYLKETTYDERSLDAVADNMAKQVLPLVDCQGLEKFYGPKFETNGKSVAWISGMLKALKTAKCTKSELYFNAVTQLHALKPSFETAYELAVLWQKKNKIPTAVDYYEQAAKLQSNTGRKGEMYMAIADLYRNSDKAKAKEYALKAAETNPKSGLPYLFIGQMYMSLSAKDCNLNDFERKALVWPAVAMIKKAEVADPALKATVAAMETEYLKNIPTKKEAKAVKKGKGDVITYGCWINESVTLPKLK
jgi:hypothetical protein